MFDIVRSAVLGILLVLVSAMSAGAAQLIMIDNKACPYCRQWNKEVGATYSKSPLGRIAPLRRVYAHKRWPSDLSGIQRDSFTPTFILVDDGQEVGRIRGYLNKEWFWANLKRFAADIR